VCFLVRKYFLSWEKNFWEDFSFWLGEKNRCYCPRGPLTPPDKIYQSLKKCSGSLLIHGALW